MTASHIVPLVLSIAVGSGCSPKNNQINLSVNLPMSDATIDTNQPAEKQFACSSKPEVTGVVQTKDGGYSLNLSRLDVQASMKHKVDIDAFEDRSVNSITILLEESPGCVLELSICGTSSANILWVG